MLKKRLLDHAVVAGAAVADMEVVVDLEVVVEVDEVAAAAEVFGDNRVASSLSSAELKDYNETFLRCI